MYISYFDESGDDGFPSFSSPLFVMTCVYMNHADWKSNYEMISKFRRYLKTKYNIPVKQEMHTRDFIQDKAPYHAKYLPSMRKEVIFDYFKLINVLSIKIINVVIDKEKALIRGRNNSYKVLDEAFTYSIQRLENDMNKSNSGAKFMIFTDEGRIFSMRKIARRIQKINYLSSQFNPGTYRKEIENLIEDPIAKTSNDSYFIQLADTISYIVTLYGVQNLLSTPKPWGKRVRQVLNYGDERKLLDNIQGRLNLNASPKNKYGIVYYPK